MKRSSGSNPDFSAKEILNRTPKFGLGFFIAPNTVFREYTILYGFSDSQKYFKDVIALINESGETSDFVDICELGKKLGVPDDVIKEIVKIKDVYEKRLIKHD